MAYPAFDPKELNIVSEVPGLYGLPGTPVRNYPVDPGQACRLMYQHKSPWQITSFVDVGAAIFIPAVIPDNVARAMVLDGTSDPTVAPTGGKDMFGIDWEYIAAAGGSMVRPGQPTVDDVNDLESILTWPDIDSWDWEGSRKANEGFLAANKGKCINTWIFTGFYERMISMMDFGNAIVALIDDDQKDAIHAFMDKLSDLYCHLVDKMLEVFPEIDGFYIHDDWGSQMSSFFSPETGAEMLVPYMKKLNDRIHAHGRFAHLHSCGHLMNQVENFIAAGYDAWDPQPMNDTFALYEKYGDRILIGLIPDLNPETTTEEEQRTYAREFAEKYCKPGKQSMLSYYSSPMVALAGGSCPTTPAFLEELYIQTRANYRNDD